MNVSITPELENFVQSCVSEGRYNNASEAIRAGLRLLQEREVEYQRKVAEMRAEIEKGIKGPFEPLDMDSIIAEAKAERAAKKARANG